MSEMVELYGRDEFIYVIDGQGRIHVYLVRANGDLVRMFVERES